MSNIIWAKPSKQSRYEQYVTLLKDGRGLCLSSAFIKNNDLFKANRVSIGIDTEDKYTFYLKFTQDVNADGFLLNGKDNNRFVNCRSFVSNSEILSDILEQDTKEHHHFEVHKDRFTDTYYFHVIPNFERMCLPDQLPKDINGIYQYLNKDQEVIYIGEGNIKQRYNSPERKNWDILTIEYSQIEDMSKRKIYESIHIQKYENAHGKKPLHNIQGGKILEVIS